MFDLYDLSSCLYYAGFERWSCCQEQSCCQYVFVWLHLLLHSQCVLFLGSYAPDRDHYVDMVWGPYPNSIVLNCSDLVEFVLFGNLSTSEN